MKKEAFDALKKEIAYIGVIFLAALIIFKIAFFRESIIVLSRIVLSLFWLFILPGYFAMLYWRENIDFIERIVIGIAISAGITGIASYYIGLIGLNIKYHLFLLPVAIILTGLIINLKE